MIVIAKSAVDSSKNIFAAVNFAELAKQGLLLFKAFFMPVQQVFLPGVTGDTSGDGGFKSLQRRSDRLPLKVATEALVNNFQSALCCAEIGVTRIRWTCLGVACDTVS